MARIAGNVFQVLVLFSVIFMVTCFSLPIERKTSFGEPPEEHMDVMDLITSKAYPSEMHTVQTDDAYLLTLHRIPHGRNGIDWNSPRPVVFLQHGLLSSSADWIMNLANESLAFILADAGYDVWMGNARGNTYSRKHIKYTPNDDKFWDFSWDQMAKFDLPAMVNFALKKTNQTQLYYVGHSQGTTMAFGKLSEDPEFAKKVKTFFALSPVINLGHTNSPLSFLAKSSDAASSLYNFFGVRDFLPTDQMIKWFSNMVCSPSIQEYCKDVLFLLVGVDPPQLNQTRLPVYFSYTPAGTSTQNIVHFVQMMKSNKLQAYDYEDPNKNMEHYNQTTPPVYDIAKITTPVAVFWGKNDLLADPTDVRAAMLHLKSIIYNSYVKNFDNMDFILGMDAYKQYNEIIKIIRKTEAGSF